MAAAPAGGGTRALSQREQDIQMMLAADVHLGTRNCDFQLEHYVYKRRTDGISPILSRPTKRLHRMRLVLDI
jgi:small subunit ribosomal protein SAe